MSLTDNIERRAVQALRGLAHQFGFAPQTVGALEAHETQRCLYYSVRRQLFGRIYTLNLEYHLRLPNLTEGQARWVSGQSWQSADSALAAWLNGQTAFNRALSSLDTESVQLRQSEGQTHLNIRLLPGCFIWTLLPPMHYFVRLKAEEVSLLSALPELLLQQGTFICKPNS